MSYEKQTWQTGDVVTSAKLNHMEDGIAAGGGGSGILLVTATLANSKYTLDKTAAELEAAMESGAYLVCKVVNEDDGWDYWTMASWYPYADEFGYAYKFRNLYAQQDYTFEASEGTDYPSAAE